MKMCKLSLGEAQQFYGVHQGKPFYDKLTHFMSAGRIVAMELVRDGEYCRAYIWHVCECVCMGVRVPGCMVGTRHADFLSACVCCCGCLRTS